METTWTKCADELPPEGVVVLTKVDDADGVRAEQPLLRQSQIWFLPDRSMYVYYRPTHWREAEPVAARCLPPPLTFYGCSDDTFGEYGRTNEDHDNCANGKPIRFLVTAGSSALVVVGQYTHGGTWRVGVERFDDNSDEGAPLPTWPMRLRNPAGDEPPHSVVLEIDAPAETTVAVMRQGDNR